MGREIKFKKVYYLDRRKKNFVNNICLLLLLFLMLGFFLFGRVFSHINLKINDFPIYITEVFLFVSLLLIIAGSLLFEKGKVYFASFQRKEFTFLYIIFLFSFIRGLFNYELYLVLRQSAIIYYSAFYFLVPILLNSLKKIKWFIHILFFSNCLLIISEIFKISVPGLGSFRYYYFSIALILLIFCLLLSKKKMVKLFAYILILIDFIIIIFDKIRGSWVSLFISVLFIFYLYFRLPVLRKDLKKIVFFIITVTLIIILVIFFLSQFKPGIVRKILDEFEGIYKFNSLDTAPANNVKWRLMVWGDIFRESLEKPLLGYGFGKPFLSESLREYDWLTPGEDWMDPHNSYLSILYRIGFIGLFAFLFIIFRFFKLTINFINNCKDNQVRVYIAGFLTTIVFILGISLFAVVLEGPFLGIFLWINMGIVVSLIRVYKIKVNSKGKISNVQLAK